MQSSGRLEVSPDSIYDFTSDDLQDLGEIGRGAFGTVNKMVHRKSNTVMAVKVLAYFPAGTDFGLSTFFGTCVSV